LRDINDITEISVSSPENKIFVNSIPHCGTHLVTSVLDLLGFNHSKRSHWQLKKPNFIKDNSLDKNLLKEIKNMLPVMKVKDQKTSLNWRSSTRFDSICAKWSGGTVPVSVGSPRQVRITVINKILKSAKSSEYIIGHVPHNTRTADIFRDGEWKGIFVIRDPRAMLLSELNHIRNRPHHIAYQYLFCELDNDFKRMDALLQGFDSEKKRGIISLDEMYRSMLDWENETNFIMARFEDLVGFRGGGNRKQGVECNQQCRFKAGKRQIYNPP